MSILSERDRSLLWEDVVATPDGKPLQTLGEVLDALQVAWEQNADLLAACKALPIDSAAFDDASHFKDYSIAFFRAMTLARAAIAKAEPNPIT
jgi:hypothetical protein